MYLKLTMTLLPLYIQNADPDVRRDMEAALNRIGKYSLMPWCDPSP